MINQNRIRTRAVGNVPRPTFKVVLVIQVERIAISPAFSKTSKRQRSDHRQEVTKNKPAHSPCIYRKAKSAVDCELCGAPVQTRKRQRAAAVQNLAEHVCTSKQQSSRRLTRKRNHEHCRAPQEVAQTGSLLYRRLATCELGIRRSAEQLLIVVSRCKGKRCSLAAFGTNPSTPAATRLFCLRRRPAGRERTAPRPRVRQLLEGADKPIRKRNRDRF